MLVEDTAKLVLELVDDVEIVDWLIGVKYSISIAMRRGITEAGIAIVPLEDVYGMDMVKKPPLKENLVDMVSSFNILEKSLGVSALNALSQYLLWVKGYVKDYKVEYKKSLLDIVDDIVSRRDDLIVVVGNMVPLVRKLEEKGYHVLVFERNPTLRLKGGLPDCLEYRMLKEADIVIVTGATLVNDTVDLVLDVTRKAYTRILVGPTASIYPELFLKRGFTFIAGTRIIDPYKAIDIIRLGGGRWDLDPLFRSYIVYSNKR